MARARNIKPGFFKNEYLAALSPYARLLFIGLWTLADVEGRMEYRPARIKAEIFPYESVDVDSLITELASSPERFIIRYQVDASLYLEIPNFSKHQNPHKNEKQAGSRIPAYPEKDGTCTVLVPYQHRTSTVQEPYLHRTAPADSLLLIPDSLTLKPEGSEPVGSGVSVIGLENETDPNQTLAQEGMLYLASLNSPNHQNIGWIQGFLKIQLQELAQTKPDIPKPEILRLWRDTCDLAVSKNATAPQWLKTTLKNKLETWTAEAPKAHVLDDLSSQAEALLKFPFIRHKYTPEWFRSDELEIRPESPSGLSHKKTFDYYPAAQLEGCLKEPSNA